MILPPYDAWVLARLTAVLPITAAELASVSSPWRPLADRLAAATPADRLAILEGFRLAQTRTRTRLSWRSPIRKRLTRPRRSIRPDGLLPVPISAASRPGLPGPGGGGFHRAGLLEWPPGKESERPGSPWTWQGESGTVNHGPTARP